MARSIRPPEQDADAPAQPAPDSDLTEAAALRTAATGADLHPVAGGQPESDAWSLPAGHAETEDPLLDCLAILAQLLERPTSPQALKAGLPLADGRLTPAARGAGRRARRPQRPTGAPAARAHQRAHPAMRASARRPLRMRAGRAAAGRARAGGGARERRRDRAAARRHRRTVYRPCPVRPPAVALRPARRPGGGDPARAAGSGARSPRPGRSTPKSCWPRC